MCFRINSTKGLTVDELKAQLNTIPEYLNSMRVRVEIIEDGFVTSVPFMGINVDGGELQINGVILTKEQKTKIQTNGYCMAGEGWQLQDYIKEATKRHDFLEKRKDLDGETARRLCYENNKYCDMCGMYRECPHYDGYSQLTETEDL